LTTVTSDATICLLAVFKKDSARVKKIEQQLQHSLVTKGGK
jgi:hypothetical protein